MSLRKSGSFGNVILDENNATKIFTDDTYCVRESLYLTMCRKIPHICEIKSYDLLNKKIVMRRYQYDLTELSEFLPIHERIYISQFIMEQMLNTISCLHYNGIIHGDIKPANIFCNYDSETKKISCFLGDFSLSRTKKYSANYKGYGLISPPENGFISRQSDIWMLGASIICFITNELPKKYIKYNEGSLDFNQYFPNIILPKNIKNRLEQLLKFNAKERITFETCKNIKNKLKAIKIFSEQCEIPFKDNLNVNNIINLPARILKYENMSINQIIQETTRELLNSPECDNITKARRIKFYLRIDVFAVYIFDFIANNDFLKNMTDKRYIKDVKSAFTKYYKNKSAPKNLVDYFF